MRFLGNITLLTALLAQVAVAPQANGAELPSETLSTAAEAAAPQTPGFHEVDYDGQLSGRPLKMACNVFLPKGYVPGRKTPLLVYLIGIGDRGSHNGAVYNNGPTLSLMADKDLAEWAPFILFTPQCPADMRWEDAGMTRSIAESIQWAMKSWSIDPDRVYLTGLSMGGVATWNVALESKGAFAAIAPICGKDVEAGTMADAVRGTTVCIICGGADNAFTAGSRRMYQALRDGGADVVYVELPGKGHGVWPAFYASRSFYEFLLLHQRGRKPPASRPAAEQLVAIGETSPDSADARLAEPLSEFLPWWFLSNCGRRDSPGLKAEAMGRKKVFVTAPLADQIPCRLMYTLAVPSEGTTILNLAVAANPKGEWELIVRANSKDLLRRKIGDQTPTEPWTNVAVDLSAMRGQTAYLELLNCSTGAAHPEAYWGKVEINHIQPAKGASRTPAQAP